MCVFQVSVYPSCWPMCMVWCPSLCVEEGVVAWAEGRDEASALTLMKTTVRSQVSIRIATVSSGELHHLTCTHDSLHVWLCAPAVADAWRALKSPSLGESSLEGAVSGLSTTSPSEGLSAPGTLRDTPHFNTLAGGALGTHNSKYSRWETGYVSTRSEQQGFVLIIFAVRHKFTVLLSLRLVSVLPLRNFSLISLFLCMNFGPFLPFFLKYMLVSLELHSVTDQLSSPGWKGRQGLWPKNRPSRTRAACVQGATVPAPGEWLDPSSRPTHSLTGGTLLVEFYATLLLWIIRYSCIYT